MYANTCSQIRRQHDDIEGMKVFRYHGCALLISHAFFVQRLGHGNVIELLSYPGQGRRGGERADCTDRRQSDGSVLGDL